MKKRKRRKTRQTQNKIRQKFARFPFHDSHSFAHYNMCTLFYSTAAVAVVLPLLHIQHLCAVSLFSPHLCPFLSLSLFCIARSFFSFIWITYLSISSLCICLVDAKRQRRRRHIGFVWCDDAYEMHAYIHLLILNMCKTR